MKNSKIFILTAVHNEINDTKMLLQCVYGQTHKNFEVCLVDDGSTDGTTEFIQFNYPKVNILRGDGNLWWTGSLNLGLKEILRRSGRNDYVWIINNDCLFSKNTLNNLHNFASEHSKSIIGSLILDSKTKKIRDNGVKIDWARMRFSPGGTDALSTKGTLYPVKVFKDIGFFDAKHFPHYFSDYEFSLRAKRNGYSLIVCPGSKVYNRVERTGIGKIPAKLSITGAFELLFSKKSKVNLLLQINMIRYVCPKEFRLRSSLFLISKIIKFIP